MQKAKIGYIERKFHQWVSIEKAFRQIAKALPGDRFETSFEQLPYLNNAAGTLKNLLFFRPKDEADIYHMTGQAHYIALVLPRRRTVLSIMDVRFLYMYSGLRRFVLKKLLLDLPVKRLDYITAISEETKREIVRHTGCDPAKIRVLDLPLVDDFDPGEGLPFNAEKPRLLQVGTTDNKNIPNVARALRGLRCKLVIIGRLDETQLSSLRENNVDFENMIDLDDEALKKEYRNADIVIFCSIYEGFGLPIIEAQSMRKPVVTSDLSPMKETAGRGAAFADPHDAESIRKSIAIVIEDAEYRASIVQEGVENVRRFEPQSIAARYAELYDSILKA
jgi:glycosyltransferase involved in cell wall biosynthesis